MTKEDVIELYNKKKERQEAERELKVREFRINLENIKRLANLLSGLELDLRLDDCILIINPNGTTINRNQVGFYYRNDTDSYYEFNNNLDDVEKCRIGNLRETIMYIIDDLMK